METGTLKTNLKTKKRLRRETSLSGVGGASGGNNGGGNDGGDDGFDNFQTGSYEKSFSKSKIFTWLILVAVLMMFGGLIIAYIFTATNGVLEWEPFNLPFQVYFSTVLILISSITYTVAQKAISSNNYQKTKKWLLATTVLGAMFIASQLVAWIVLVNRGFYMQGKPFTAFFYIMTALHAIHVIGGIIALGYIVLRCWVKTDAAEEIEKRREISNAVGWYWHCMGGLWLILLFLLGFWK